MPRRKLNYKEGDVIRIPLPDGEAVGVLARIDGTGGALGYFFLDRPPLDKLQAQDADHVKIFGDLLLLEGKWDNLGPLPGRNRADWPIPVFFYKDPVDPDLYFLRSYDEKLEMVKNRRATAEDAAGLPRDGLSGAQAVEISLQRLLEERAEKPTTRRLGKRPLVAAARRYMEIE